MEIFCFIKYIFPAENLLLGPNLGTKLKFRASSDLLRLKLAADISDGQKLTKKLLTVS